MGAVKLTNLSRLFRHFADMIDNGYCDNITEDDIGAMTEVLKPYLNVKVNYEQAKKITGKTDSAFNSKISRCGLKPTKERLYIECRKNPQVFSLLDVRHYPWFLIYSITVFGLASPIEQTKYPSDHKVFSFQKYFLNILSYKRHEKTVLSCFSFLTIDVTDSFGG